MNDVQLYEYVLYEKMKLNYGGLLASSAMDVLELQPDGSFSVSDAVAPSAEIVLALKDEGNALLKAGDLAAAAQKYGEAAEAWEAMPAAAKDARDADGTLVAQCLANHSLALLQLGEAAEALVRAQAAVDAAPSYAKAHYRVGKALDALGRPAESAQALLRARELTAPSGKASDAKAKTKARATAGKPKRGRGGGAFLAKTAALYPEKEDVVDMSALSTEERALLRSMCSSVLDSSSASSCSQANIDGLFKQMLDPQQFQKAVYPGVSGTERSSAPQSFQALLRSEGYCDELAQLMPRVKAKAHSVLDNVKRKGAAAGDVMDAATEAFLWPQVLREAFAHEALKMVKRVSSAQHLRHANDNAALASPHADQATWDQLPRCVIPDLAQHGFTQLDGFLGEEWPPLILADVRRFASSGRMARAAETDGMIAWIEVDQCTEEYPALAELLQQLHALPHELNRKGGLRLSAASRGTTMLTLLAGGDSQPARLDCGQKENANGYKLTCAYFFDQDWDEEAGGLMVLTGNADRSAVRIAPLADRLVLFRSREMQNAVTAVGAGAHRFALTFWVHGPDEEQ